MAQEPAGTTGPGLAELLKKPAYSKAWQSMLPGDTLPGWLAEYSATLDGPPVPTIPVDVDGRPHMLGFTCKPNGCEENQLYVLFTPDGAKAWALMVSENTGIVWLGDPDDKIQAAIKGALKK
ncbi:MAG: Ivy family c-type lysozyme inhibitor [Pseudomonadota bacterium]